MMQPSVADRIRGKYKQALLQGYRETNAGKKSKLEIWLGYENTPLEYDRMKGH